MNAILKIVTLSLLIHLVNFNSINHKYHLLYEMVFVTFNDKSSNKMTNFPEKLQLKMIPTKRPKRTKPRPIYSKTECLKCELITSVKQEQRYFGMMPNSSRSQIQSICPFCNETPVITFEINEYEYHHINQQWDMVTAAEEDKSLDDWQSWMVD